MPSSLTPIDVTHNYITATPAPTAIPYHYSVAIIPSHVTTGINNGSESDRLDVILEIIEMGIPPYATVAISSICDKIYNSLSRAQGYLQEVVVFSGSPNTVSAI